MNRKKILVVYIKNVDFVFKNILEFYLNNVKKQFITFCPHGFQIYRHICLFRNILTIQLFQTIVCSAVCYFLKI